MEDNYSNKVSDIRVVDVIILLFYLGVLIVLEFVLIFASSNVFGCGKDYLYEWDNSFNCFVYLLIVLLFQIGIGIYISRYISKVILYAYIIVSLVTFHPLFFVGREVFSYSDYYEDFNAVEWNKLDKKPMSMIRPMYNDFLFVGKSRKELFEILGRNGIEEENDEKVSYRTDCYSAELTFLFVGGIVEGCQIDCVNPW